MAESILAIGWSMQQGASHLVGKARGTCSGAEEWAWRPMAVWIWKSICGTVISFFHLWKKRNFCFNSFCGRVRHEILQFFEWLLSQDFGEKTFRCLMMGFDAVPIRDGTVAHGGCTFCTVSNFRWCHIRGWFYKEIDFLPQARCCKYLVYFRTSPYHTWKRVNPWRYRASQCWAVVEMLNIRNSARLLADETIAYLADCLSVCMWLWRQGLGYLWETPDLINRAHSYRLLCERQLAQGQVSLTWSACQAKPMRWCWRMSVMCDGQWHQGIKASPFHLMTNPHHAAWLSWGATAAPFSQEEYVSIVCDQLGDYTKHIVIHRITGVPRRMLIGLMWSLNKWEDSMPLKQKCVVVAASKVAKAKEWNSYVKTPTDGPCLLAEVVTKEDTVVDATDERGAWHPSFWLS